MDLSTEPGYGTACNINDSYTLLVPDYRGYYQNSVKAKGIP